MLWVLTIAFFVLVGYVGWKIRQQAKSSDRLLPDHETDEPGEMIV